MTNERSLIIGIDYTNEYCQACYYNLRHERPESVMTGSSVMRYLIPAVLCYNDEKDDWLIGEEAMLYAEQSGSYLFRDLLVNTLAGTTYTVDDEKHTYDRLMAIYFGKLLELTQIHAGMSSIRIITISMRKVDLEIKAAMERVFSILHIDKEKVRLQTCAESFAYYVLNEDPKLWRDGALLFDFAREGFFAKQLTPAGTRNEPLFYINERNYSMDFSIRDLGSEMLRADLDRRLTDIYRHIKFQGPDSAVFFTGEGFSELWFRGTLEEISKEFRAFKGNNLYVKGACLAGYILSTRGGRDYPIICRGRTRASVSVIAYGLSDRSEIELSPAAKDWYDAGGTADFILYGEKKAEIVVTSLVGGEKTKLEFDLSSFPDRPKGTTRVEVSVNYNNEKECEIRVRDKGFGAFFEGSGEEVIKRLDLEGYI